MATSLTFESALRVFFAAPVPRPPQPTRPTFSALFWPATRLGARAQLPATALAARKSRRVGFGSEGMGTELRRRGEWGGKVIVAAAGRVVTRILGPAAGGRFRFISCP